MNITYAGDAVTREARTTFRAGLQPEVQAGSRGTLAGKRVRSYQRTVAGEAVVSSPGPAPTPRTQSATHAPGPGTCKRSRASNARECAQILLLTNISATRRGASSQVVVQRSLALLLRCRVTYGNVLVLGVPDIPGITRPSESRIRVVCKQVGKGYDTVNAWTSSEGRDGVIYLKYSEGSTLAM